MNYLPPWLRRCLGALLLALAAWLLWRQVQGLSLAELRSALARLAPMQVAASMLATTLSFACLAAYERLATQWLAPGKLPRAVAWRTGLVAHALANTLGFHPVTAVALRLRSYRAHGIDAATLAKIVAAIGGCVAAGALSILALAGAWALWCSGRGGLLIVLVLAGGAVLALRRARPRPAWPGSRVPARAGGVLALGLLETAAAIAALAVLLPSGALPDGPAFALLFVAATALGIASHAPGGVGVFEATMLSAADPVQRAPVLAALLAYRVVYNLLPCALALLALAAEGLRARLSSKVDTRA